MYFKVMIIYIKILWNVLFIILNDQNLSVAFRRDVGHRIALKSSIVLMKVV